MKRAIEPEFADGNRAVDWPASVATARSTATSPAKRKDSLPWQLLGSSVSVSQTQNFQPVRGAHENGVLLAG